MLYFACCLSPVEAQTPGVTNSSIVIGSCTPLEGPAKRMGLQVVTGASAYFQMINDSGGINGRKIKLVLHDDGFDPEKASGCFENLQKDNIFAVGFIVGGPTGQKYMELAEKTRTPILGFFSGARQLYPLHNHYSFNVRASYRQEIRKQLAALRELGIKEFGVIYPAGPSEVLQEVTAAMQKDDPILVNAASYPRNTLDVDTAIATVHAQHSEAVIVIGPSATVGEVIKRSHQQGWKPMFLTPSFAGADELIAYAGADAEGTVVTQVVPPYYTTEIPTVGLYRQNLTKYYPEARPSFISLEGFVDALVLVEGLKRAGPDLTREKFVRALESIHDLDIGLGPNSRISYSPTNHTGSKIAYLTVIKGGMAVTYADVTQAKLPK
jgi:ABC-type branched-subunit amino acid transport system substrate-binding protein